jgi:hypothetical protein
VANADGTIPSGTHLIEVTAGGVIVSCTFQVPLAMQPDGGTIVPQCIRPMDVLGALSCSPPAGV